MVVATPPDVSGDVVKASLDRFPEAIVTDVASVKARIVGEVAGHPGAERYAGSHPMAGRERSGAIAADADLFVGRPWVITPVGGLQEKSEGGGRPPRGEEAVRAVQRLALAVGSLPVVMDPPRPRGARAPSPPAAASGRAPPTTRPPPSSRTCRS